MSRNKLVMLALSILVAMVFAGCANKFKTSGKISMGSKNWDKALADFQQALGQTPNDGEVHYLIAMCYKEKDDFAAMVSHLNAADTLYAKGEKKIHNLRESTWKELFEAGNTDTKNGNYEKARGEFETAIDLMPDNYAAYINLGVACQHLEDIDCAYSSFKEAYRLEPENIQVLENFANYCFNIEKYDEADVVYARILEKDPGHVNALIYRGAIAGINEDFETVVNYYKAALEKESDNCDLWFNLGFIYLQNAIKLAESLEPKVKKKSLCQLLDDETKAFTILKEIYPSNEDKATKALALIKDYCGILTQAEEAFVRVLDICPDDVKAHINLGVVLLAMERFDEAAENLETLTLDFPDECVGWDLYSQALLQKGMRSKALDAAKKFEECKGE